MVVDHGHVTGSMRRAEDVGPPETDERQNPSKD